MYGYGLLTMYEGNLYKQSTVIRCVRRLRSFLLVCTAIGLKARTPLRRHFTRTGNSLNELACAPLPEVGSMGWLFKSLESAIQSVDTDM